MPRLNRAENSLSDRAADFAQPVKHQQAGQESANVVDAALADLPPSLPASPCGMVRFLEP